MKKFLLLFLILPLFVACGSDDDDSNTIVLGFEKFDRDVFVGGEYQIKAVSDLKNPTYIWESSNSDIASIDNTGTLKALKEGQTTIKVTLNSAAVSMNIKVLPIKAI